ncbi:helix-turn-helix transcriptional regulator [Actinomycetospora cinnamomea]|uniref:helix-turn-helix transcriptional regulator n=1 Tax=Actinomycetospora cinnamomea TaxID=663609 RepID=UPI001057EE11|nr:response regulator transcription factor [Actinomycetospora cinnamomea]
MLVATSRAVDVLVLDLGSIPSTWPGLVTELRDLSPAVRVVTIGAERDDASAVAAARAGAHGWLLPGGGVTALVDAVVAVHRGAAVYPPGQLAGVLEALRADVTRAEQPSGRFTSLTIRELEVLRGLVEGYPARELAEQLGLAVNTIRTHTNRIFRKLGVHGRLEAVRLARAEGLAPTRGEGRPPHRGRLQPSVIVGPPPTAPLSLIRPSVDPES